MLIDLGTGIVSQPLLEACEGALLVSLEDESARGTLREGFVLLALRTGRENGPSTIFSEAFGVFFL